MKAEGNVSSGFLFFIWILNTFLKFQQKNIGTGGFLLFLTERNQGKVDSSSVIDCLCDLGFMCKMKIITPAWKRDFEDNLKNI